MSKKTKENENFDVFYFLFLSALFWDDSLHYKKHRPILRELAIKIRSCKIVKDIKNTNQLYYLYKSIGVELY